MNQSAVSEPETDNALVDAAARKHRQCAYVLASYKRKPDSAEKTAARVAHEAAAAEWALLHFARLVTKERP